MSTRFFCPRCRARISSQGGSHATCPGCGLVIDLALADTNAGAPSFVPIRDLSGETIGNYQLHDCLGSGGMGTVYRATHSASQEQVAIKLLSPPLLGQPDLVERFHREAQALAGLAHTNIVGFKEEGHAGEQHYIVMDYVPGENLEVYLARGLPEAEVALDIVLQIARALDAAHTAGIIHRDLKPANVIVNDGRVTVLDFGIAHVALEDLTLTHSNAILGTVNYMAPEQRTRAKEVDHRADLFSLGVLFYRMLTDTLPLGSFEPPTKLNSQVPRSYDRVVARMLRRDPERRHADAEALLRDLYRLESGRSATLTRVVAWSAAACVAVLTGTSVILNVGGADEPGSQADLEITKEAATQGKSTETTRVAKESNEEPKNTQGSQLLSSLPTEGANSLGVNTVGNLNATRQPQSRRPEATLELKDAKGVPATTRNAPGVPMRDEPANDQPRIRKKKRRSPRRETANADTTSDKTRRPANASYIGSQGSVLYGASSAESKLIRPLKPGESITVLKVRRGKDKQQWAAIRTSRGERGFVKLTSVQSEPPRVKKKPSVNKKGGKQRGKKTAPTSSMGKGTTQVVDQFTFAGDEDEAPGEEAPSEDGPPPMEQASK